MNYDAEVVGVVGDVRHEALDRPAAPSCFVPYSQSGFYALTFVVRTAPGSPATLQALKEQIWAHRSSAIDLPYRHARRLDLADPRQPAFQPVPARRLRARDAAARDGRRVRRDELYHQPAHA